MGSWWYKTVVFDMSTRNADEDFVFLDKSAAIDLFRPLEELKSSCTKICFGNHIFGVEAALVAQTALMDIRETLRDVEFEHFVFGRSDQDEALEVIQIFSSALKGCMLTSLTLALGDLGQTGVEAFAPLLKSQKTLEKLKYICNSIPVEAAGAVFDFLPSIERIEKLYFIYNKKVEDAAETFIELVKKCIALEGLYSITDAMCDAMDLEESLEDGSSLRTIDFEYNSCAVVLSPVIYGYVCLTNVDLRDTNLQDEGVIAIALSLKNTALSLRILAVGGNDITPKAAPALAECLAGKDLLTAFTVGRNKLKDDGSVIICKAISEGHEQLKTLDLSSNGMTGIGAKAAAEAVANKPNFSRLNICGNFITKKGIETVKDVLRKGTNGEPVLGHIFQYKDVGAVRYQFKEEGLTDSDTESEETLQKQ